MNKQNEIDGEPTEELNLSPGRLIEMMGTFTQDQIKIICCDPETEDFRCNADLIKQVYNKAYRNGDFDVISILCHKYPMTEIFRDPTDLRELLPVVSGEDVKKVFDYIYEMINTVSPNAEIEKAKKKHRNKYKPGIGYIEKRIRGGEEYHHCFKNKYSTHVFSMMSFLCTAVSRKDLIKIWRAAKGGTNGGLDIVHIATRSLAYSVATHKECYPGVFQYMRHMIKKPFPIEDIIDMENGTIEIEPGNL